MNTNTYAIEYRKLFWHYFMRNSIFFYKFQKCFCTEIINETLVSHWFFTGLSLKGLGKTLEFIVLFWLLDLCSLGLFKVTLINICKDSSADVFSKHLLQKHYKVYKSNKCHWWCPAKSSFFLPYIKTPYKQCLRNSSMPFLLQTTYRSHLS